MADRRDDSLGEKMSTRWFADIAPRPRTKRTRFVLSMHWGHPQCAAGFLAELSGAS